MISRNMIRLAHVAFFSAVAWLGAGCDPAPATKPAADKSAATTANATAKTDSKDPAPGTTNTYEVKGIVREIKRNGTTAVIQHEEVTNYMPAMTMPLSVKDAKDLAGVKAGDQIAFRLLVTVDDGWIDTIRVLSTTNMPPAPPLNSSRLVRNVDPLKIGDTLPNYPFVNEFGKELKTDDYRGKAVALTFIFTRCPFPNFCPRMSENFKHAYQALETDAKAPKNWQFFSLSFDTYFDNPAILKSYAQRYHYNPEKWSFLTGAIIDIDDITERFGLAFSRDEGTLNFNHTLRTVVLDTRGRVHHIFIGNEWKPEELAEKIKEAAAVPTTGEAPPPPKQKPLE